jgi:methionine-rich copper-binding protein CopC
MKRTSMIAIVASLAVIFATSGAFAHAQLQKANRVADR